MTTRARAVPLTFSTPCDPEVYDLHVTCSDNVIVYAHRQVLMSRCTYYREFLNNKAKGVFKMTVSLSSHSFKAMLQYLYTGVIHELEHNDMEGYLPHVAPLYQRSVMPRYHHIAGLDDYLTEKFISQSPPSLSAALAQLRMAYNISSDLCKADDAQPSQVAKVQMVLDHVKSQIGSLPFTKEGLRSLPRGPSITNILELVVRDVPLQTSQIDICEALAAWATPADDDSSCDEDKEVIAADDDDDDDSPMAKEDMEGLLDVDPQLLKHIDLSEMSAEDLCYRLPQLRLFPLEQIVAAKKALVLKLSNDRNVYQPRSDVNQHRGRSSSFDPGHTIVAPVT